MSSLRSLGRFGARAARAGAYVAVVAKLLVPLGYMPGPLAAGLPVRLCEAGFAPVVAREHERSSMPSAHAHHGGAPHEHDQASELHWKHCPSGALAAAGAIPVEHRLDLVPAVPERFAPRDAAGAIRTAFIAFRSRAPPLDSALA